MFAEGYLEEKMKKLFPDSITEMIDSPRLKINFKLGGGDPFNLSKNSKYWLFIDNQNYLKFLLTKNKECDIKVLLNREVFVAEGDHYQFNKKIKK